MAQRRIVVATNEVIRAARCWADLWRTSPLDSTAFFNAENELRAAIEALDALDPTQDLTAPGSYVYGSPDTSQLAAVLAAPVLGSTRRRIVDEIRSVHLFQDGALTDDELEHRLKQKHTTVSSARNWLVNHGWLEDSGLRRKTSSGRPAVAWRLTPAGRRTIHSAEWVKGAA